MVVKIEGNATDNHYQSSILRSQEKARCVGRWEGRQAGRWEGRHACRQADRQIGRQIGR